jgi:predicted nucleic acid-binding protein
LLVLDASAAVDAALAEEGFDLLEGQRLVAPPLLWSESASALHEMRWRKEISEDLATLAFRRLGVAPVRRRTPAGLAREAWRVADELGWAKTYDAEYVALARMLDCPLLTVDARLKRGASRIVRILGPAEL